MIKVEYRNVERGGIRTTYAAEIWVDGHPRGYLQKVKGHTDYQAYMDGRRVTSAWTLTECRADIRYYLENTPPNGKKENQPA